MFKRTALLAAMLVSTSLMAIPFESAEAKSYSSSSRSSYSKPSYRKSPTVVRKTVIQKNYYQQAPRQNYGSSGSGVGSSILGGAAGAVGGIMLMDALTEDEGEKALKLQQEQIAIQEAKDQQERDDKINQLIEAQKESK